MGLDKLDDRLAFDRDHLWHPYSSISSPGPTYAVESASGVRLRLVRDGVPTEVIDAMSSWWCAVHGYAVPELDAAATEQLGRMSHVMFGGLTHEPAIRLGKQLVDFVGLDHVFFADSGSVAVEVAMKMAWQAHAGQGWSSSAGTQRTRMFTIRGGYHGDTFSPMSVCDPDGGMHSMYAGLVPEHVFAPRPPAGLGLGADDPVIVAWESATRALFEQHAAEIAAVIVEPVLQGAGGMHVYSPYCVDVLTRLAREHGALVIHDEIATAFWRTGPALGADRATERPDIVCVGKALTGGYLSLSAVLCTAEVAARVSESPAGAMMHGPTFMANPLACAIASASLDLLVSRDAAALVERISGELATGLAPALSLSSVVDVRTLGAVGVIELDRAVDVPALTEAALDRGVWVRPFRNLVYTMPPYVASTDDVATITGALVGAVAEVHG
ncbi:MAG: adenosylmethionine-8-amino-7-oxononanoate aminotransferase [Marmoricola sp.]|jgi:adenosylmethionine-8-amino-7-oxononanoate aminotransferase|nr:adenosylmethionine-8-amino-7-oxononanoate aminotransferase [Marmoricola sp.]